MVELVPGALHVEIFVAKHERAARCAHSLIGHQERGGVAQVKQPRRRRRKASAIDGRYYGEGVHCSYYRER